jgi:hypothetical protein
VRAQPPPANRSGPEVESLCTWGLLSARRSRGGPTAGALERLPDWHTHVADVSAAQQYARQCSTASALVWAFDQAIVDLVVLYALGSSRAGPFPHTASRATRRSLTNPPLTLLPACRPPAPSNTRWPISVYAGAASPGVPAYGTTYQVTVLHAPAPLNLSRVTRCFREPTHTVERKSTLRINK